MKLRLDGKTALITGASKGIGKAISIALEGEGVKVTGISRKNGWDLMDFNTFIDFNAKYDILINNVGGMGTCKPEDWHDCMHKNYGLMLNFTEKCLPYMIKQKEGRVITISSIYGKEKGHNPYFTAAKSAQIAYMKSQAGKYEGITFNTISPGYINTKADIKQKAKENNIPLGNVTDISNMVLFLCSEKAEFVNGANIPIDGGYSNSF